MAERTVNQYRCYCTVEATNKFVWGTSAPTVCPTNAAHAIDLNSVTIVDSVSDGSTIIKGQWHDSKYYSPYVTPDNKLQVALPLSAFGLMKIAQDVPQVQIDYRYGINSNLTKSTTTGSGTITAAGNAQVAVASGAATNSSAILNSIRYVRYATGQGVNIMFTALFSPGVAGNVQLMGAGTATNGFFVGYNGTSFGLLRRNGGVNEWILQPNFNLDKLDGTGPSTLTIDPTKGNVYKIDFKWLGYGAITFSIEGIDGGFAPIHRINYSNQFTVPTVADPAFPMWVSSTNTTNNTNVTIQTASFAGLTEGVPALLGPTFSEDNTKNIAVTTLINIVSFRVKSTFRGFSHFVPIFLRQASVGADATRAGIVYLIRNGTLGGTPVWTDISTNESVVEWDTAGTSVTGGFQLASIPFSRTDAKVVDLQDLHIYLQVGDIVTLAGKMAVSGSGDVTASLTWQEDR